MIFICPKCKGALNERGGSAVCECGHSFDRAKEGYYNLLLSMSAGNHGDSREMVESRRSFLSLGHYAPLAEAVADFADKYMKSGTVLVDQGCGEGYYTEIVARRLNCGEGGRRVAGFDISKDATRRAAKRVRGADFAVASAYHTPLADGSVDGFMNVFSPLALEETLRALAQGGILIMAIPERRHLYSLKACVYDEPYENEPEDFMLEGLSLIDEKELSYTFKLASNTEIKSLFNMTPYSQRTSERDREKLERISSLDVDAHFRVLVYRKNRR
ncbi:MAG: methyltransferase domain-containing protein [Clostridia bacterium]|nr:methyltransferase domain-containing protein [Clostridia bacterium]